MLLALCALVAMPTGTAQASSTRASGPTTRVRVPRSFFGLHDESLDSLGTLSYGSLRLWDAHVRWEDIETSPGVYDWTRLDTMVQAAQTHHVQLTLVLAMTPSFYSATPSLPPTDLSHYRDFVQAAMERYRDFDGQRGISSYQVWNEGNVPSFWTGTQAQLAQLTQIAWQVRNAVDPGATVVAPSFAVRLFCERSWMEQYQSQVVDGRPVWHFYDVNSLSLYPKDTYGTRTGTPEDAMALLAHVRHLFARVGVPAATPVWASEINYGLPVGTPGLLGAAPIDDSHQVANVIRTYVLGAARGLSRIFWYRYDWWRNSNGATLGNTLLADPADFTQLTAAGQALTTAETWLHGRLVGRDGREPCAVGRRGTYRCIVKYAHGTRTILWNPDRDLSVPLPRDAVSVQSASGREALPAATTGKSATLQVSYEPVMVLSRR